MKAPDNRPGAKGEWPVALDRLSAVVIATKSFEHAAVCNPIRAFSAVPVYQQVADYSNDGQRRGDERDQD
jgi:hypothetical protein